MRIAPYARALAAHHGMRVEARAKSDPTWDGRVVNSTVLHRDAEMWTDAATRRLVHEVAHFIVAPKGRKRLPNYGLGTDNLGGRVVDVVGESRRERDERLACLLGVAIVGAMRGPDEATDALSQQGWTCTWRPEWMQEDNARRFWETVGELQRMGLLVGHEPHPSLLPGGAR